MDFNDNNEQDVAKLVEILNRHKTEISKELEDEFGDFINFDQNTQEDILFEDSDTDADAFDETTLNEDPAQQSSNGLTEYEAELIDSCTDPELQQVLTLNRSKNFKLIKLRVYIDNLLYECDKTINQQHIDCGDDFQLPPPAKPTIWKLGAPYFKSSKYYFSPYNEDVKRKKANRELLLNDLLYEPQQWTKLDCDNLLNGVLLNYNVNRQISIKRQICSLKQKIDGVDDKQDLSTKIRDLELELERLNNVGANDPPPPLNSNEFIDWNKIADTFLYERRTGDECRALWHIYLHPSINKKSWTKEENNKLNKLAEEHNYQDWEMISMKLETNRSPFTVALHYYRDLHDKYAHTKFTKNEDQLLLELIDLYRIGGSFIPWRKISEYFPHRSRPQLYHHYTYYLSNNDSIKKGKFSDAEDILLLILVDRFGTDFRKCAEYIENRSQVQLKSRYRQNLENHKRKGSFTNDDDAEILEHVKQHGECSWGILSQKLNRTRGTVRQRYMTIKQYLKTNLNADIDDLPKRKHRGSTKEHQHHEFIRFVAGKFKDAESVPTLDVIQEFLQNPDGDDDDDDDNEDRTATTKRWNGNSRGGNAKKCRKRIDTMLIDFFANSCKLRPRKYVKHFDKISNEIGDTLTILGANLEIPANYRDDSRLDGIDKIILNQLTMKNDSGKNQLIAPNINTLVGLRSVLLKHKYLEKSEDDSRISWEIERNLLNHDSDEQNQIIHDRQLFAERFNKLFTWSSILSVEPPPPPDCPNDDDDDDDDLKPIAKRLKLGNIGTYSRRSGAKPSTSRCNL